MMKKPVTTKASAEQVVKDIRRATRKLHSSEHLTSKTTTHWLHRDKEDPETDLTD